MGLVTGRNMYVTSLQAVLAAAKRQHAATENFGPECEVLHSARGRLAVKSQSKSV
jgi:hypothetical protein